LDNFDPLAFFILRNTAAACCGDKAISL